MEFGHINPLANETRKRGVAQIPGLDRAGQGCMGHTGSGFGWKGRAESHIAVERVRENHKSTVGEPYRLIHGTHNGSA